MKIEYMNGSNVISIQPMRSKAKFPAIAMVEAYWEGLRNGRPMPARAEVDPRGISDALEYAFILEKIAPGHARIRLAGNHLNELMGMEVRGMPMTSLFLPAARIEVQKALELAFSKPASVRLNLGGDTGFTRPNLEAQMFLAPMKDEKGLPTRILGALQSNGKIGRAPRRFEVRNMDVNTLFGEVREVHGASDPFAPARPSEPTTPTEPTASKKPRRHIPGLAEHATGFTPRKGDPADPADTASALQETKKTPRREAAHLRLVCDNDA